MTAQLTYRIEVREPKYDFVLGTFDTFNGKPMDRDAANEFAAELRNGSAVKDGSWAISVVGNPPSKEQVWQILLSTWQPTGSFVDGQAVVDAVLPSPMNLHVDAEDKMVQLRLPDNERGQVDAWAAALGLPLPSVKIQAYRSDYGSRVYDRAGGGSESSLLPGWTVSVSCELDTRADASAHGDGLASPDPTEYTRWLAAREAAAAEPSTTAGDVPTPPKVVAGTKYEDGSMGVELSCGVAFDGFTDRAELDQVIADHAKSCTGQHDWTRDDDTDEPGDEPMPEGVEGVQLGRAAEVVTA